MCLVMSFCSSGRCCLKLSVNNIDVVKQPDYISSANDIVHSRVHRQFSFWDVRCCFYQVEEMVRRSRCCYLCVSMIRNFSKTLLPIEWWDLDFLANVIYAYCILLCCVFEVEALDIWGNLQLYILSEIIDDSLS